MSRVPDFIEPQKPELLPILQLHRGHDGYVTFHRKDERGRFEDLFAIKATELNTYFPQFLEQLEVDSYYSVNAFWRGGYRQSELHPSLRTPLRRKSALRWLTACYSDLDVGRADTTTVGQIIGAVIDYQDAGVIPPASMMVRSGRGLWLFWILRDEKGAPVNAWPEAINAYCKVQYELCRRLAHLEADPGARDVSRVTRIPGSIHRGTGRRVAYSLTFQMDRDGRGFAYSLEDLCRLLGVHARKIHPIVKSACNAALSERGREGFRGRLNLALLQFEKLRAMRRGFREGHRGRAALLYASLLHKAKGMSAADIRLELRGLAAECDPPWPESEADAVTPMDVSNMQNQTIADWLEVTPAEAEQLETWPAASRFQREGLADDKGIERLPRAERAEQRRQLIRAHIQRNRGKVPTFHAMQDHLDAMGVHAAIRTIERDYDVLGVQNPRQHKGDARQGELLPP